VGGGGGGGGINDIFFHWAKKKNRLGLAKARVTLCVCIPPTIDFKLLLPRATCRGGQEKRYHIHLNAETHFDLD
jgi:hypothetical protein